MNIGCRVSVSLTRRRLEIEICLPDYLSHKNGLDCGLPPYKGEFLCWKVSKLRWGATDYETSPFARSPLDTPDSFGPAVLPISIGANSA